MTNTQEAQVTEDHYYDEVRAFHTAFGHPVAHKPTPIALERATSRAIWTAEELVVEFLHQTSENEEQFLQAMQVFQAGLEKAVQKSLANAYPANDVERIVGQVDALGDGLYFTMGSFNEIGLRPREFFDIIQGANMAKLGEDGKPIIRKEDGKIMKPEGWMPPEPQLEAEVLRQIELAN